MECSNTLIIDKRTPIFHEDQFFTLAGPLTYYALPVQKTTGLIGGVGLSADFFFTAQAALGGLSAVAFILA